tara:strand:+ start:2354 stop:3271 length:918 start_codon:yes stop_codon:yes gene_type:complete
MAFSTPRTWVAGEVVTAAIMNQDVRDNIRFLRGLDGVVTTDSGLIIDNTDGDEFVRLPSLSTAETGTALDAAGDMAYDEQTNTPKYFNGSAVKNLADHGDMNGLADDDHTQYSRTDGTRAFTGTGNGFKDEDNMVSDSAVAAASQQSIKKFVEDTVATKQVTAQVHSVEGAGAVLAAQKSDWGVATLANADGQIAHYSIAIPSDFTTLTKAVVVLIGEDSADVRIYCQTDFGADGEAHNIHSDSVAAANVTLVADQIEEYDISGALTAIAAGDHVGIEFLRDGAQGGDTSTALLNVAHVLIEYTA